MTVCRDFRPDHNGECLNCDEWFDAHVEADVMDVFLVVVILKPTQKAVFDDGAIAQIIVQPTAVLAKDAQQATMKAARYIPEEHADKGDRLEVRVLPFAAAMARV